MTVQEVVWFMNHKYGEQAYVVETKKEILLFSLKSKWIIKKSDFKHFHTYTLFHFNDVEREHYHVQLKSQNLDYLVYQAIAHDNENIPYSNNDWKQFNEMWNMYLLGREIEGRVAAWDWLCGRQFNGKTSECGSEDAGSTPVLPMSFHNVAAAFGP